MWPLVVVLSLLPAVVGSRRLTIDALDALWGLKALAIAERTSGMKSAAVGNDATGVSPFAEAPPLGTWLAATVMQIARPSSWRWLFLPSLFAAGFFVAAAYLCLEVLLGARVALLGTAALALHAPVLTMASDASPLLWSLPAAAIAVWGAVAHWRKPREWISLPLLACCVALGLCFLAGGVVALAVLVTVTLAGLVRLLPSRKGPPEMKSQNRPSAAAALPSVLAVGVACVAGLFLGSWWCLTVGGDGARLIGIRSFLGFGFQPGGGPATFGLTGWEASRGLTAPLSFLQALVGVFVLGLFDALGWLRSSRAEVTAGNRIASGPAAPRAPLGTDVGSPTGVDQRSKASVLRRSGPIVGTDFLLLWIAVGLAFWGVSELIGDLLAPWSDLWKRYLIIPVLGLSAHGLNLMIRRRVSVRVAILGNSPRLGARPRIPGVGCSGVCPRSGLGDGGLRGNRLVGNLVAGSILPHERGLATSGNETLCLAGLARQRSGRDRFRIRLAGCSGRGTGREPEPNGDSAD